ncbi:histidine phosphatase family protein [Streptomyces sp. MBT65]|uniref:histidine phosphatase family protein n=1 Tax=Streptomyces sp. MBT65 TaxID=1488395 RepID=UPI00190B06FE|nr:histidine phosphatase family protein [Streptomyces sp. MBT65]MBK3579474.1 histidine phosphatase family protein [Streptomyces sp. MBT65]
MGVILFVRHGKASVGAADYDVLSDTGELQSELLGAELARRGVTATRILTGRLNRQQQTARCACRASKWSMPVEVDEAWNEFHHEDVVAAHREVATPDAEPLDRAIPRWSSGRYDHEYTEPFPAFTKRVDVALRTLAADLASGETAVVFTSAGVIGWIAASLLGGGAPQWSALNRVAVNSGVTKVVVGSRGSTLLTFNEHSHLPPQLVTYR